MCYKGKCFNTIPVENGCLAIATLIMVASGLGLVASVIVGILNAAGVIFTTQETHHSRGGFFFAGHANDYNWGSGDPGMATSTVIALVAVACLITFIFSFLLCNGIINRRPGLVQAYFVYGVVITIMSVLASMLFIMLDLKPGFLGLFGCVVYSLFLVMVHQTYTKLSNAALFKRHIRLVESY